MTTRGKSVSWKSVAAIAVFVVAGHRAAAQTLPDTTAPQIVSISADPSVINRRNHKMVPVNVTVVAVDDVDPNPDIRITSISSSHPAEVLGDGNTEPDFEIAGPLTALLRAEAIGHNDRTYTIRVAVTDASGNTSTTSVQVVVPGDNGRK